jgi:hypothetical protein
VTVRQGPDVEAVLALLDAGEEPGEGELIRLLRQASCPGILVERLAKCRWVVSSHRVLQLVVRHPRCPRAFAWDALPRLGWHDLLEVGRDPRTSPAIRKQAERKLVERIVNLTLGERTTLAKQATRGLLGVLLTDEQPLCVEALLSNPHFTETEALRLLNTNIPLGVALGLLALLPEPEIVGLAGSAEVDGQLRDAANRLLQQRRSDAGMQGDSAPS